MRNGEGYPDPTAGKAIRSLSHLPKKIWEPVKQMREALRRIKLDLVEITIEDRITKKKYTWRR